LSPEAASSSGPACPTCGERMHAWPRLDGSGHVYLCRRCPTPPSRPSLSPPTRPTAIATHREGARRFRNLTRTPGGPGPLLPDMPPELRLRLEKGKLPASLPAPAPTAKSLPATSTAPTAPFRGTQRSHRTGYGPRPTSADVMRLAAHLERGSRGLGQRVRCPKCDAVVPADDKRCLWCGRVLSPGSTIPVD
jgi:hypothetical protein